MPRPAPGNAAGGNAAHEADCRARVLTAARHIRHPLAIVMSPRPGEETAAPSAPARRLVSTAIVCYLAGLLLTMLANTDAGTSRLVRTLKARLFSPWMVPAWLDLGFATPLTYGEPADADHRIEIGPHGGQPGTPPAVVLPGELRGERAARWRRLARAIASAETAEEDAADLAAAVAAWSFARLGCADVDLRVMRSARPGRAEPAASVADERAFAARVRRVADELHLLKVEPRGEVAPLVPEAGRRP